MKRDSHKRFLKELQERVFVCDGAMGTLLHAKGIAPTRCLEELNLTHPSLVQEIHNAYRRAGADILETNTFGGNALRLAAYGLEGKCREINHAAVRLTRAGAGEECLVAGAVGPLGSRMEPHGPVSIEQAQAAFREQIKALADAGADLILLETFCDLDEIREALTAARAVCDLPLIAQVSTDHQGNLLDGTEPEVFTPKLAEWGADAVGCNCGAGPEATLETIRRMAAGTSKPLTTQPSAGLPMNQDGRISYPCSPESFAHFAKGFLRSGVRVVGGCCGTTPEHIRALRNAVDQNLGCEGADKAGQRR